MSNFQRITKINISSNNEFIENNDAIDSTGKINEKLALNKFNYIVEEITTNQSLATADIIFVKVSDNYILKRKVSGSYTQYNVPVSSTVYIQSMNCIYILKEIISNIQNWINICDDLIIHNNTFDTSLTETAVTFPCLTSFIDSQNRFFTIDKNNRYIRLYDVNDNVTPGQYIVEQLQSIQIHTEDRNNISCCVNEEDILFVLSSTLTADTYYLKTFNLKTQTEYTPEITLNTSIGTITITPYKLIKFEHFIYLISRTSANNGIFIYNFDYSTNTLILLNTTEYTFASFILNMNTCNDIKTNKDILYADLNAGTFLSPASIVSVFDNTYNITIDSSISTTQNVSYIISDYIGNIFILPYNGRHQIIKYTPDKQFITYNATTSSKITSYACVDKNNNIFIVYENDNNNIGVFEYDISAHDYIYNEIQISSIDAKITFITLYKDFLILGHGDTSAAHNIIVYKLPQGNLINYNTAALNNNLSSSNSKVTIGKDKIILNGYNGDIKANNINLFTGNITKQPINDTNIVNKEYSDKNKGNYYVNTIVSNYPQNPSENDIIFKNNNSYYSLMIYKNNSWIDYDVSLGATCLVNDINTLYIRKENENNHQVWLENTTFDPSQTLTLTNEQQSLITEGPISIADKLEIGNNIDSNSEQIQLEYSDNSTNNSEYIYVIDCYNEYIYFIYIVEDTKQDLVRYSISNNSYTKIANIATGTKEYMYTYMHFVNNNEFYLLGMTIENNNGKLDLYKITYNNSFVISVTSNILTISLQYEVTFMLTVCNNIIYILSLSTTNKLYKCINIDTTPIISEITDANNVILNSKSISTYNNILYIISTINNTNTVFTYNDTSNTFTQYFILSGTINKIDGKYLIDLIDNNSIKNAKIYLLESLIEIDNISIDSNIGSITDENYIDYYNDILYYNTLFTLYCYLNNALIYVLEENYNKFTKIYPSINNQIFIYVEQGLGLKKSNNLKSATNDHITVFTPSYKNGYIKLASDEVSLLNNCKITNKNCDITGNLNIITNTTDDNMLYITQGTKYLKLGYSTSPIIVTNHDTMYIMNSSTLYFTDASAGIKLSSSGNIIKGITTFNNNVTVSGTISLTSGTISTSASNPTDIINKTYFDNNSVGKKEYVNNVLKGEIFNIYEGTDKNTATGEYSHAEGKKTEASGDNASHAEGNQSKATGGTSHAEGYKTTASNDNAHSEGNQTSASGANSHAEGNLTSASGTNSHAGGYYTFADQSAMTAIGKFNLNTGNSGKLFVVGNGTATNARKDAFVVKDTGECNVNGNLIVTGSTSLTSGTISTSASNPTDIINKTYFDNNSVGKKEYVSGVLKGEIFNVYSGNDKNVATGEYSHAEGYNTISTGEYSHASGYLTVADQPIMTVVGMANVYDSDDPTINENKVFVVGNGTFLEDDVLIRRDAFVVKHSGECDIFGLVSIQQNSNKLNLDCYNETYISTDNNELYLLQGNLTSFASATSGIKLSNTGNEIKGVTTFNNNVNISGQLNINTNVTSDFNDLVIGYNNTNKLRLGVNGSSTTQIRADLGELQLYSGTNNDTCLRLAGPTLSNFTSQQFAFNTTNLYVNNSNLNIITNTTDNNVLSIKQGNKQLNLGYNTSPYISTTHSALYLLQGNLTSYTDASSGIKISNTGNEIKGNTSFNGSITSDLSIIPTNINHTFYLNCIKNDTSTKRLKIDCFRSANNHFIMCADDNIEIYYTGDTSSSSITSNAANRGINITSSNIIMYGDTTFNNNIILSDYNKSIQLSRGSDTISLSANFSIGTAGGYVGLYSNSDQHFFIGHPNTNIIIGDGVQSNIINMNAAYIEFNGSTIHPSSSNLSKSRTTNSEPVLISACDDYTNIYILNLDDNKYIINKYTSFSKNENLFKFTTENTIYNIYYFNNYLLLLSNNGIDYINLLNKELELTNLLKDTNINKIVIDPNNNKVYVLYNSYDYFSRYIIDEEGIFIKSDYHVFTTQNGFNPEDLNIIDMKFYNNYIYFIHPLYKQNDNYYIVYSNYTEKEIVRKQSIISFTNEYYYIDSYVYEENIYFLITKNGENTELIKINKDDVNDYYIYDNLINDNITQYNKNIYYKYNDNHFYLVSNNYIYYFSVDDNIIQLENKLYADGCKYITYNQDIIISNSEIKNIKGNAILNGNILLNGQIKTSTINASQINISDIDVNVNKTITHNTLIDGNINNYCVGEPVFIKNNKTYILQRISNDGKYPIYEYIEINDTTYLKNTINQIPMVTNENNGKFIGIITSIYPINTPLKINDITSNYIKINNDTIEFATHGDYIFKVNDNTALHNTTSGSQKIYEVGDNILFDGTIIDSNTPITYNLIHNCVGCITYIPINNTDYVSVFKN